MVKVGSEFIELEVFFMFKREKEENTRVFIPVIARSRWGKGRGDEAISKRQTVSNKCNHRHLPFGDCFGLLRTKPSGPRNDGDEDPDFLCVTCNDRG